MSDFHLFSEPETMPTLKMLQGGLVGDSEHVSNFMELVKHLLRMALEDPGTPNTKEVSCRLLLNQSAFNIVFPTGNDSHRASFE
jgi:hypothetical protein